MAKRECGTCTKCCEGWLTGESLGHKFYKGRPCHFLTIGKGCTVYAKRPQDPCVIYKCEWLKNEAIPEWMKPSEVKSIADMREVEGIPYLRLIEAGEVLASAVLTWFIQYAIGNGMNFYWEVENSPHYLGSPEFIAAISKA